MSVNVGTAIGYLDLDTTKFKKGFNSAYQDLQTFNDKTATSSQKLSSLSSAMTSMGGTLTKSVTVPLAGMGAAIVKTTSSFEAGMSEVAAISGATGEDLQKLSDKAKEMGAVTKFSATDSAEALKYMAMAGWDTQKMLDGLPGVMNLAAASGENLGTVSDIVTDALTAFGMKAEEAGHFADVLAKASSKSNTNVSMMGETFKYVAPVAGALGYSCEDTAIAVGLMANSGIKASQAGTSLRQILLGLQGTVELSGDSFGKWVIETQNADGSMRDLHEILGDLREAFANMTEAEKAANAESIAGKVGMSGLLAIVNATEEDYAKLTEEIYNADGAAQQMADTMNDNLSGQLTILGSTIEGIALQFGDIMLPAIKSIVQGLQNFATWLNSTSETTKRIIVVIATVAAALGPLLLIGGKLIQGFLTIKTLLTTTGMALSAITGPIGIVIAAVAALALAWATNFGGIRDTVSNVMSTIFSTISTIVTQIKTMWDTNWMGIQTTVKAVLNAVEIAVETALGVIEGLVQVFAGVFAGDWTAVWEGVKQIISSIWEGIKKLFKNSLNWLVDTLISIAANLYVAATNAFQKIKDGFNERWEAIKAWFDKAKDDPVGTIKALGSKLYSAAKNAFNKLWQGFKNVWKNIESWFKSVGDWIASKLKFWESSVDKASKTASNAGSDGNSKKSSRSVGSYAKGLDYVPYDGFPAILHKGERVLTAKEANAYNNGQTDAGSYQFNFYSPQELSPAEQTRQFKKTMNQLLFNM